MQVRLSDVSGNQIWIKFSCVVFILHADFRVNVTIRQLNLHFQGTYFGKTALRRQTTAMIANHVMRVTFHMEVKNGTLILPGLHQHVFLD